jgi:hypothetical protein
MRRRMESPVVGLVSERDVVVPEPFEWVDLKK